MNKQEFIKQTAKVAGIQQAVAEQAVNAALDVLAGALASGERVKLQGFGSFAVKERTITGRNFKTQEVYPSHAQNYVYFDASDALREEINTGTEGE